MPNELKQLDHKKIAILGLGIENFALVEYLLKHRIDYLITVFDRRTPQAFREKYEKLKNRVAWKLGNEYRQGIDNVDIMFRSPGWPLSCPYTQQALKSGIGLSSPMRLFFEICPSRNIVGVTGTKGKGTTASLIYHILKQAGKRVWLGGNIGVAPLGFIDKIKPTDWIILELSSFQLEDLETSPKIAVITNFTAEHLSSADPNNPNYHSTLSQYRKAKSNIVRWQKRGDTAIINEKLEIGNWKFGNGKKIYFTKSEIPSKLAGEHNRENVAAAVAAAKIIGIKENIIKKAVAGFKGLEHRLEYLKTVNGVKYYNDSFATTPEAAITALESFTGEIILLCGGAEKKSDFTRLAREIKKRVKFVVLFKGQASPRLHRELARAGYPAGDIRSISTMKAAVRLAAEKSGNGDIVLLSPACASFGMFKNYKERGRLFKEEVQRLK